MNKKSVSVPRRFLIAITFALFAASGAHAAPTPAAADVYKDEVVARPLDNVNIYQPPNDCGKYTPDTPEYKCCKAGIYETNPEWSCCAKGDPKGCDDGNSCTDDTCASVVAVDKVELDIKKPISAVPQCLHTPNDNCSDCDEKYKGQPEAIKCCNDGFDTDPAKQKCCVDHLKNGKDPGTPANPKPCNGCPECPNCTPKVNCDLIGDPKMKSCCTEMGGLLYFVMDKCIEDGPGGSGDCNIVINAGGDFINNGQMNICCQVVNNTGTITDTTISQACTNTPGGGPGGATTGGTGTTPEGSASALTCSVALVGAPVDGKFAITYTVPGSSGPVVSATLTQLSGSQIKVEGEAEPSDFGATVTGPKSMSTKAISDPNNPPSFTVYAPTPKSMVGEWKAPFEVKVSLATLDGEAGSALCTEDHYLHAEGTGCGCSMTATLTTREQVIAYLVFGFLLLIPFATLRTVRKLEKK